MASMDKRQKTRKGAANISNPAMPDLVRQTQKVVMGGGLAAIVGLTLCAFGLAATLDREKLAQQERFLDAGLAEVIDAIPTGQSSSVIWDDAVLETRRDNQQWMQENLGEWMGDYFGFDATMVLNEQDQPIHVMRNGETATPVLSDVEQTAIRPLLGILRDNIRAASVGGILPYEAGAGLVGTVTVSLAGEPAVISIKPIVPSTSHVLLAAEQTYLHVAIQKIDAALLSRVSEHFELAHLVLVKDDIAAGRPLVGSNGENLGTLVWEIDRPAVELLQRLLPYGLVCGLVLVGIATWLLSRLKQTARRQRVAEERALYESLHDPLTGLVNRSRLDQVISMISADGEALALHVLDIDWFRSINDTLGNAAGDELLRQIASRLKSVSGPEGEVARVGGDEFAVLQRLKPGMDPSPLAATLLGLFEMPFVLAGDPLQVRCSLGVAAGETDLDRQELFRRANIALSRAKAIGRGRHVHFAQGMDELVRRRNRLEKDLRRALNQENEITVVYQPILAANGYTLSGAEALVRWRHPIEGNIPPDVFVEIAEDRGLIEGLGELVLRRACTCAVTTDLPWVAVNVSPVQLRSAAFFDLVLTVLAETGLEAHRLLLEITEGSLLENTGVAQVTLQRLRQRGIRIALDDFGTGYSSMNYLANYAVDKIKIDKSFVAQLTTSQQSRAIVKAIVSLAHAFKLRITAEGVETTEQRDHLAAIGCHEMQGFLFSRPLEQSAFIQYAGSLRPEAQQLTRKRA